MSHFQGEYACAREEEEGGTFVVGRVLVLNDPPATMAPVVSL